MHLDVNQLLACAESALKEAGIPVKTSSGHKRLSDADLRLIDKTRVRLAGFTHEGQKMDDPTPDFERVRRFTGFFTRWVDELHKAVRAAKADPSQRDQFTGLTPDMKTVMDGFAEHGGLSGVYPMDKLRYIHERGLIALVELEVRTGMFIILAVHSCLSTTPWETEERDDNPFYKFGFSGVITGRTKTDDVMKNLAFKGVYACQTAVAPSTSSEVVLEQLTPQGMELPEEFQGTNLLQSGIGSRVKGASLAVGKNMESEYATTDVGQLERRDDPMALVNRPGRGFNFNSGLTEQGRHELPVMKFDPEDSPTPVGEIRPSEACLRFIAYAADLATASTQFAETAIAKGHPRQRIEEEIGTITRAIQESIRCREHFPW